MRTVSEIADAALHLSLGEREALVDRLVRSFGPPGEDVSADEWSAAWLPELRRRDRAYENGETQGLGREDALAEIREAMRSSRAQPPNSSQFDERATLKFRDSLRVGASYPVASTKQKTGKSD
ncbi:MAG: addiction module protein [Planctomycetes bacterium]|nr:addiction module protein [Planctomycetota bacterium]